MAKAPVSESEIQNAIFLELGRESDVTLWRNNTGQAKSEGMSKAHMLRLIGWLTAAMTGVWTAPVSNALSLLKAIHAEPARYTRYGLCKGSSDIIGIVAPGIFLALEVKRPDGPGPNAEQQMFLDLVNRRGGVGRTVRSVDDARAAIAQARVLARSGAGRRDAAHPEFPGS